jgi:hypothetical protein
MCYSDQHKRTMLHTTHLADETSGSSVEGAGDSIRRSRARFSFIQVVSGGGRPREVHHGDLEFR